MSDRPSSSAERLTHWDGIYGRTKAEAVGWYQSEPVVSLALIGSLGIAPEAGIVDVGGGASTLVDRLVSKGFSDLTVLDISPPRSTVPRQRLGPDAPVARRSQTSWNGSRRADCSNGTSATAGTQSVNGSRFQFPQSHSP